MKLETLFTDHYQPRRLRGKSKETVRLYWISIRSFGRTLGRNPLVSDLTNENISRHMQQVLDNGRAKATANKDRAQLLTLWRFASQHGFHQGWPDVQAEPEPIRQPRAWLKGDIEQLLSTARSLDGTLGKTDIPRWVWWNAILLVCLDTGERIGAVKQATWDMLEHGWLLIPAEHRKGGKRDRRYRLSDETLQVLEKMRPYCTQDMFPWPYTATYLWNRYDKILQKAGLPHGPKDKFHRCRKTLGSVAYAAGLDPQEVLDHSSRRVSQAYLDARFTRETAPSTILRQWLKGELPAQQQQDRKQA